MSPFIANNMMTALRGFSSTVFSVRNSSNMLFSTLLRRIFGTKKNQNGSYNTTGLTGKEFFSCFPSLRPFLIDRVSGILASNLSLHPELFPLLILFSNLCTLATEEGNENTSLAPFRPFVFFCALK